MNSGFFVKLLLRSPLHGLYSKSTMIVTLIGRKTGRTISLPVSYYGEGGVLWVISRRDRKWWRNLRGGADVALHLRGHKVPARGEAILDKEAVTDLLRDYLTRFPKFAKYIFIQMKDGVPDETDLQDGAEGDESVHR